MRYSHRCPYCDMQLGINQLSEEKVVSKCPCCQRILIVNDYGRTLRKPYVYKCHKCGDESTYEERVPMVRCDKCGTFYLTAPKSECMIEVDLLYKGDKGELPYTKKQDRLVAVLNRWRMLSAVVKATILTSTLVFLGLAGFAYYASLPPPIETSQAYADMDALWKEFRDKNPFSFQMSGLKRYEDNSYVAIISEPTENVSEKSLQKIFKKYNCCFRTHKKKIGYDGWLRDAVISFNDASTNDIPKIAKELFKTLYGTDYKAAFMDYSVMPEHTAFSDQNLNFQISAEELRQWFFVDKELLVDVDNPDKTMTLDDALADRTTGMRVLMSKTPGFIVWILETEGCDYGEFRVSARKFAVDSDLVFGAISKGNRVAVVARERSIPLYELPPMRQETLHLLASTDKDELAQSYERTSLFAGKQKNQKDFAPIYLSPELWHTEYGNILNITDQMLKSWSENGNIEYTEFDYPKPVNWAFECGVREDLGVNQLTYNWNTAGVGYEVEGDGCTIYALNRTGSLPVSYIPGETDGMSETNAVYLAEEKAYDFFSGLSSPELVKVVQYVSMYQIFKNLDVRCGGYAYDRKNVFGIPSQLVTCAGNTLDAVARFGTDEKRKIGAEFKLEVVREDEFKENEDYAFGMPIDANNRLAKKGRTLDALASVVSAKKFIDVLDAIREDLSYIVADKTFMDCLPRYMLDRNGTDLRYDGRARFSEILQALQPLPSTQESERRAPKEFDKYEERITPVLLAVSKHGFELQRFNFIVGGLTVEQSKELYLAENRDKSKTWMKCPTIVESWNVIDSENSVGGHNLNSKVSKFRLAEDLKPGQTRRLKSGVIEVSKADMRAHATNPAYLRRVGRLNNSTLLAKDIPVRSRSSVLKGVERRSARGFNSGDHLTVVKKGKGFELQGRKVTLTELFDSLAESMTRGNVPVKEIEIVGLEGAGVEVQTIIDGVACRMPRGLGSHLSLSRYDMANHMVEYSGDKAIVRIPLKPGRIEYGSTSKLTAADVTKEGRRVRGFDLKSGEVRFDVPKSKVKAFLDMLREFFNDSSEFFNEMKLKLKMKKYDIDPLDCEERDYLKVAKLFGATGLKGGV